MLNHEKAEQPEGCTIDVTVTLTDVTGIMFLRETRASGEIEGERFEFDTTVPGGCPIIRIGTRVFLLPVKEIVSKIYSATRHATPDTGAHQ
jgi:hypothetical protein